MTTTSKLCPCCLLPNTSALMGHWSFNGTLDDVSPNRLGPAVLVAGNSGTALAFETQWPTNFEPNSKGFVKVRTPGWINIPSLQFIQNESFTLAFSLRLSQAFTTRQTLLGNWTSGNWQFITFAEANGKLSCSLRRNMQTNGSNPEQGLVDVETSAAVPVGSWIDVAFTYDATKRTLAVYIDGVKSNSSSIRASVTDTTLHTSTSSTFQLGLKADDQPNAGTLNADIRHVRAFKLYASTP
ncbi:concanavalin A-like lectin/glucanase domain-containing protein [Panaeolus papilionaceus]|nr:concanavalin A-like lectin/glucanase domain-containing protein [Panaeolus papilionaceus]